MPGFETCFTQHVAKKARIVTDQNQQEEHNKSGNKEKFSNHPSRFIYKHVAKPHNGSIVMGWVENYKKKTKFMPGRWTINFGSELESEMWIKEQLHDGLVLAKNLSKQLKQLEEENKDMPQK